MFFKSECIMLKNMENLFIKKVRKVWKNCWKQKVKKLEENNDSLPTTQLYISLNMATAGTTHTHQTRSSQNIVQHEDEAKK